MAQASAYPELYSSSQIPDNLPYCLPKDLKTGDWLIWTRQADTLAKEVVDANTAEKGFAERFFVISGPSGIGKSCLAFSVAVQMREMGEKVLYVPDAERLLHKALELAEETGKPSAAVRTILWELYKLQNSNNKEIMDTDTAKSHPVTQTALIKKLSKENAIVIFDEHGKAYLEMKKRQIPKHVFQLIYPSAYEVDGKQIRVLFAGSNQESFETTLNSSYQMCQRHVQPMIYEEVNAYCTIRGWTLSPDLLNDFGFYCNFVPREMNIRVLHDDGKIYTKARGQTMYEDVSEKVNKLTEEEKKTVAEMLENLFLGQSFAVLTDTIPFFDMGLIYRKKNDDGDLRAFPMCHPAEKALTALWKDIAKDSHWFGIQVDKRA